MGYFLMILATFIWGAGFVGTRWTLEEYTPYWSNGLRLLFAGIIATPFILWKFKQMPWKIGFVASALLYLGLHFQTLGISITSLAKSGFFTVFYAIFTPLLVAIFTKQSFRKSYWLLLLIAMIGIALLCDLDWQNFNRGDFFVIVSALLFSFHILWIDRHANTLKALDFNLLQCFLMGIIGVVCGTLLYGFPSLGPLAYDIGSLSPSPLNGFLILSIFSSLLAFSIQVSAQKMLKAHIVSLIFLLESVFAAAFGYIAFDETLNTKGILGCFLVLVSVALIPWATNPRKRKVKSSL
ncbi:DMT family transporter [bacterium]|nr:DMT family transporter [bacterium]